VSRRGAGQGLVEYGLILGLGGLVALVVLVVFGDVVRDVLRFIADLVDAATGSTGPVPSG
jgi:Flp pilus assembly pilin Flp